MGEGEGGCINLIPAVPRGGRKIRRVLYIFLMYIRALAFWTIPFSFFFLFFSFKLGRRVCEVLSQGCLPGAYFALVNFIYLFFSSPPSGPQGMSLLGLFTCLVSGMYGVWSTKYGQQNSANNQQQKYTATASFVGQLIE